MAFLLSVCNTIAMYLINSKFPGNVLDILSQNTADACEKLEGRNEGHTWPSGILLTDPTASVIFVNVYSLKNWRMDICYSNNNPILALQLFPMKSENFDILNDLISQRGKKKRNKNGSGNMEIQSYSEPLAWG